MSFPLVSLCFSSVFLCRTLSQRSGEKFFRSPKTGASDIVKTDRRHYSKKALGITLSRRKEKRHICRLLDMRKRQVTEALSCLHHVSKSSHGGSFESILP